MKKRGSCWERNLWSTFFLLAVMIVFFLYPENTGKAVRDAMNVCAQVLIPSLFPFMVISALLVQTGAADILCKPFEALFGKVFRLPCSAAAAVLLGALCGFPVGAKTACDLVQNGKLTNEDGERLTAMANNTGPSFIVEVIGAYYWNSRGFGVFLYAVQIVSALLIGRIICRRSKGGAAQKTNFHAEQVPFGVCFAQAVSSSASAVLGICGFVSFFSVLLATLRVLFKILGIEHTIPVLAVVLEFTQGNAEAAHLGGLFGAFLTGVSVGWSGLSVFAQCSLFASRAKIRLHLTAVCKAFQGIICGAAAMIWYLFSDLDPSVHCSVYPTHPMASFFAFTEIILLILCWLLPLMHRRKKNGKYSL